MKLSTLSCATILLATSLTANEANTTTLSLQEQLSELKKELTESKENVEGIQSQLDRVQAHDAKDNIKWSTEFRNSYQYLNYELNDGTSVSNKSLLTSRLYLGMSAAPLKNLIFFGQMAVYKTWGGNKIKSTESYQNADWRGSSMADDAVFKLRQAYFVYNINPKDDIPVSFSVGRRPATDGFLANHRENNKKPNSPLAHITNMEVDAAMIKLGLSKVTGLPGSYLKIVGGRAHDPVNQTFSNTPYTYNETYAQGDGDESVDFLVLPMGIYNDGQYNIAIPILNDNEELACLV